MKPTPEVSTVGACLWHLAGGSDYNIIYVHKMFEDHELVGKVLDVTVCASLGRFQRFSKYL